MERNEHKRNSLEIWGGVECSVVRIKNTLHDQLELSGHERRISDLQLFADSGIRTIRYPLLWEKYTAGPEPFFQLHDHRLAKLKELGITPIAGLLHHGSGPFHTSLLDPNFPELLASYAATIAKRYPWLIYYTPVNEPLTTARFSGLYGIWYPHARDAFSFLTMFLNQIKGIIRAMEEIRKVNPEAQLIQTEDICRIHSTKKMQYQADFENHRRWLTYDFLTGRFNRKHDLWNFFIESGIKKTELDYFAKNFCTPYIVGHNYYITSERFLDHRKTVYPKRLVGGNGIHTYADTEVVRVAGQNPAGFYDLLKECWNRYKLPMASTEVHLGCTREEQLRWFNEAYTQGQKLRREGIDFRAITAWAFLGTFDWNSLLRKKGNYESGVYDIRAADPRGTALAKYIRAMQKNESFENPLLEVPGWWKRNIRVLYEPDENWSVFKNKNQRLKERTADLEKFTHVSPVLIIGANTSLGQTFARLCRTRGIPYRMIDRLFIDITSRDSIEKMIEQWQPWGIINATGFSDIDQAELTPYACFRENTIGATLLAQVAKIYGIRMVTFSTDQVFNGKKRNLYTENDSTQPLNKFGESKQLAEEHVMKVNPDVLIIRSGPFFNPWYGDDTLSSILQNSHSVQKHFYLPSDIIISPTYVADLVNVTLDLFIDGVSGIMHLSHQGEVSTFHFTKLALNMAGLNEKCISSVSITKLNHAAKRPTYSALMSSHGISLPPLPLALGQYLNEFRTANKVIEKII
ncbi:MAG TPA: family 1 glycosylhydrolase [Bacteroidales bacterium]|nr:family 1 glycosylhydrolase [Bacteroidales bacterium]